MSLPAYTHLVDYLAPSPFLAPKARGRPARSPRIQVAVYLLFVGNAHSRLRAAIEACVSEGAVYNYIRNVAYALLERMQDVIRMPNKAEKLAISEDLDFPGAIGIVDGTLLPLTMTPERFPKSFYSGRLGQSCVRSGTSLTPSLRG